MRFMNQEPIAIVGLGCRYSGASSILELWNNLCNGVNSITAAPSSRSADVLDDMKGGFLKDVYTFDADFFGISGEQAEIMDPQQRLLLETTWHALEDAGCNPFDLNGTNTSVFVGICNHEYDQLLVKYDQMPSADSSLATDPSAAAGRISNYYGLCGKSIAVNTGCSSSLVALELACQELWLNKSNLAICAGTNLICSPHVSIRFNNSGWLSRQGFCKSFDAEADGYVRSEGVGVAILKSLRQAIDDRDRIYGLIADCVVRHNGKANNMTMPSMQAQVDLLSQVYEKPDINLNSISYIEANSLGSIIGDAIELKALGSVIGIKRGIDNPLRVGSIKPNIGHSEGASGMAALIKVVLSLFHRKLPPTLHFKSTSDAVSLAKLGLTVQTNLEDLCLTNEPLRAGISSFGYSGTNTHILLEAHTPGPELASSCGADQIILLTAKTATSLQALTANLSSYLLSHPELDFACLSYTLNLRRFHFDHCLAVIAQSNEQLRSHLESFQNGVNDDHVFEYKRLESRGDVRTGFVFTGAFRISQQLIDYAVAHYEPFRAIISSCDDVIQQNLNCTLSSLLQLNNNPDGALILDFTCEYLFFQLLRLWGLQPAICIGRGQGALAAACCAGLITFDQIIRLLGQHSHIRFASVIKPLACYYFSVSHDIPTHLDENVGLDVLESILTSSSATNPSAPKINLFIMNPLSVGSGSIDAITLSCDDETEYPRPDFPHLMVENKGNLTIEHLLPFIISCMQQGLPVDLGVLCAYRNCKLISLHPYAFDGQRFNLERDGDFVGSEDSSTYVDAIKVTQPLIPPSSELEIKLHAIWASILGHSQFGIVDNFFMVGGTSLLAIRLVTDINKNLGMEVELDWILSSPTVSEQAQKFLHPKEVIFDHVISFQPLGSLPPLYAVHGWGGVPPFAPLAPYFAPDRPLFGLQSGSIEKLADGTDVSQLARRYADTILARHPGGPIHLMGHSIGGWYAYAVAAELLSRGASMGVLAILDTDSTPLIMSRINGVDSNPHDSNDFPDYFVELIWSYLPPRLPLKVDLFTTSQNVSHLKWVWSFYATGGLEIKTMFTEHTDFYKPEHAPVMASALKESLAGREKIISCSA